MSVRKVELFRGPRGYGFTLSGQGPCVLSNIVQDGPAGLAGLRIGDLVLEANGRNVSMLGHDEVVKWIAGSGHSGSSLTLQIGVPGGKTNSRFGANLNMSEGTNIKPPPFPSLALRNTSRHNKIVDSSSDDDTLLSKGYREKNSNKNKNSFPIPRDGQHQHVVSYKTSNLDEHKEFVVSDDERNALDKDSMKPSPWNHLAETHSKERESNDALGLKNPKPTLKPTQHANLNTASPSNFPFGFPKPIHIRGHSEDSTLTDGSTWLPSPAAVASRRPKRHSPKKKAAKLSQEKYVPRPKHPSPRKPLFSTLPLQATHCQLGGGEELQLLTESEISSFLHPTLDELRKSLKLHRAQNPPNIDLSKVILKVVVGYLGTIEMPKQETNPSTDDNEQHSTPSISLQAIRNCIRRLRVEKKVHTTVLMCIFPQSVILLNHHGITLAEYPSTQITYCGMCTDDKRFLGLVTTRKLTDSELLESEEEEAGANDQARKLKVDVFSSSCHVFMTETAKNADETELFRRAKAFQFEPTKVQNPLDDTKMFVEFPWNAEPIRQAIISVYGRSTEINNRYNLDTERDGEESENKNVDSLPELASVGAMGNFSPGQHSNTSSSINSGTTRTSNSDSGIGYKDEVNLGSANMIQAVAQINHGEVNEQLRNNQNQDYQEEAENEENPEKFHVQAMPLPDMGNDKHTDTCIDTVNKEFSERDFETQNDNGEESFNTEKLESQFSAENIRQSMQKYLHSKHEHLRKESEQLASTTQCSDNMNSLGPSESLQREDKNTHKATLPPYTNPPQYSPVFNSSDLIQRRHKSNKLHNINNSPLTSPTKSKQKMLSTDMVSSRRAEKEIDTFVRSLEDLREDEGTVGGIGVMYKKELKSGYLCSGGSSLTRDNTSGRNSLRNYNSEYEIENVASDANNELQKSSHGGKYQLPTGSRKSDSNLSQIIGEVESCVGMPTQSPNMVAPNTQHFFLRNPGTNVPEPHLLLPNTSNSKGLF